MCVHTRGKPTLLTTDTCENSMLKYVVPLTSGRQLLLVVDLGVDLRKNVHGELTQTLKGKYIKSINKKLFFLLFKRLLLH